MRVAVTLEQCWHEVPGGTAVAALEVARRLVGPLDQVGVAARHRKDAPAGFEPPMPVVHLPLPRLALYESWARASWPRVESATGPVDVVHATTVIVPATAQPLVVTLHDVAFLHEPAHFTAHGVRLMSAHLARVRDRADAVLCSSLATRRDALEYGIDETRLRHVPLGVDVVPVAVEAVEEVRRRYALHGPYAAFVGTVEPRKNLAGLLAAFDELDDDLDLVVIGPPGWGDEHEAAADRVGARLVGFVPDADKRALLAGAEVFCYPSLREGFGLPVLEAMAQGVPVVTSRATSTEEVAGGAAVLVDPTDHADIARGIAEARARRDELGAAGRARAAECTWDATAARTLAAYRSVAR